VSLDQQGTVAISRIAKKKLSEENTIRLVNQDPYCIRFSVSNIESVQQVQSFKELKMRAQELKPSPNRRVRIIRTTLRYRFCSGDRGVVIVLKQLKPVSYVQNSILIDRTVFDQENWAGVVLHISLKDPQRFIQAIQDAQARKT
jgi:hypothetical protein